MDDLKFTLSHFENLSKQEFKELQLVFDSLDEWWQSVWKNESIKLVGWKDELTKQSVEKKSKEILFDFDILYGAKVLEKLDVYLLISAPRVGGGGANLGENKITLECSGMEIGVKTSAMLGLLFHEVSHLYNPNLHKKINNESIVTLRKSLSNHSKSFINKVEGFGVTNFITEAVSHCAFPFGFLASKHLGVNPAISEKQFVNRYNELPLIVAWGYFSAFKLRSLTSSYLKGVKKVDDVFVDEVITTLIEFFGHY